jgi:hypothetical protein
MKWKELKRSWKKDIQEEPKRDRKYLPVSFLIYGKS